MAKERVVDFWISIFQVVLDAMVFYASFYMAFGIRFYSGLFPIPKGIPPFHLYMESFPTATLVMLLVFKSMGLYDKKGLGTGIRVHQILKAIALGMFVLVSLTFMYRDVTFSRLLVVVAWVLCSILILGQRILFRHGQKTLYKKWGLRKKILLIGNGDLMSKIIKNIHRASGELYKIAGVLTKDEIDGLPAILKQEEIDEVILTMHDIEQERIIEIILECEKEMVRFRMVPDIFEILTSQVELENFYGITLLGLKQFPLEKALNRFMKRAIDITGSFMGLIIAFPLLILLSILIKRDSKGPILYMQERVGEDGKKFMMVKFRTMGVDAEEASGPVWASVDDPRRTRIGMILRQFNLDELPQLWNVLKGDMSLVGPRPERPHFVNEFKDKVPRYMSRHKIKSGVTGWAQVNGLRGNTSIVERIKYDLYYLENWSVLLDVKIILKTFFARKNAY